MHLSFVLVILLAKKLLSRKKVFSVFILGAIIYLIRTRRQEQVIATEDDEFGLMARKSEELLRDMFQLDNGTGCDIPALDPFDEVAVKAERNVSNMVCEGKDWVKCLGSECRVVNAILDAYEDIRCTYKDILFMGDYQNNYGIAVTLAGGETYDLIDSDHVRVECNGLRAKWHNKYLSLLSVSWMGVATGLRPIARRHAPKGREHTANILVFAFDSASRAGFIRRMPKSYKYLTEDLQATVLESYNVVGDGTKPNIIAALTGRNYYELPDTRRGVTALTCDVYPLLFFTLRDDGYRTVFFEDWSFGATFQHTQNGFRRQPTDHYLRPLLVQLPGEGKYCAGDTPIHSLMMNLTKQILLLGGKKFIFTFVSDGHDDFSLISTNDEEFLDFLTTFKNDGRTRDTLLLVMGDHGYRYGRRRHLRQGWLEERLPFMSIVLPERLKASRPSAETALKHNVRSLTTPYDIHATLLDAVGLREHWNPYTVPGAAHARSRTILESIPRHRSCSEAGVEPHYCACASWRPVSPKNPLSVRVGQALVDCINTISEPVRLQCHTWMLSSMQWVRKQHFDRKPVTHHLNKEMYQVKIIASPGDAHFEATIAYLLEADKFECEKKGISRTNMYGNQPHCIVKTHAHLAPYCYCRFGPGTGKPLYLIKSIDGVTPS